MRIRFQRPSTRGPGPRFVAPVVACLLAAIALPAAANDKPRAFDPGRLVRGGDGPRSHLPPGLGPAVGIKITPTDIRHKQREVDFDLTWYTRVGPYSSTYAGFPYGGFPAIDYGDGSTVPYTTLLLVSTGGGPGGSNVYRNAASFTHTYPDEGTYTATGASICTLCFRGTYTFFPPGSPGSPTSTATYDYLPHTVVGNLAGPIANSGTTYSGFFGFSIRYAYSGYQAVTNTAEIILRKIEVPAGRQWGLAALGGLLALFGMAALRRSRPHRVT